MIRPRAVPAGARAARARRRARRAGRRRLRTVVCLSAALAITSTVTAAYAVFSDASGLATTVSTAVLEPPAGLTVTQTCTPPATIALRGTTSAKGQDSLTLVTPTGTSSGDVLVAQVANRYGAYGGLTAPAGWTLLGRTTSGSAVTSAMFWRVATAAEPTSATFGLVGSSGVQMVGGIAAYRGVSTSDPVNAFGTAIGAGATASTPSVTTTRAGTMLVHTIVKRQEDLPPPAGTTGRWQLMSGNGTATAGATGADELFAGPGTTTSRTSTTGFSTEWVTHTVALRPMPGTPGAAAGWTASPSTWASGYLLERVVGSTVQASQAVSPVGATSATDGPLVNGTSYTYRLRTSYRGWTSLPVSVPFTPSC
ncbi:hypothetical protein [Blastococcus deserti]|uniref:Fibronectin type-III domain-containing protein n=1 Tax=Blastococcus deserti TaxID=2259033 RepID=A0ABW4XBL0_9ACTN